MSSAVEFIETTKDRFYEVIGPLNVHPQIVTSTWPYTSLWREAVFRRVVGKTVGHRIPGGSETKYYLAGKA